MAGSSAPNQDSGDEQQQDNHVVRDEFDRLVRGNSLFGKME